jgi:hypothetical protein
MLPRTHQAQALFVLPAMNTKPSLNFKPHELDGATVGGTANADADQ